MTRLCIRVATIAAFAAVLALACGTPAAAAASTATTSEFASRVESASAAVTAARPSVGTSSVAQTLAGEVDTLLPVDLQVVEGTATITVADDSVVYGLTSRLRAASTDGTRRDVADELSAHLASMRAAIGVAGANPADPAALKELLAASPVTTDSGDNWLNQQIAKVVQWVTDWLAKLNPRGTGASPFAPSKLIPVAVLVVPVALVLWVLIRGRRKRRGKRAASDLAAARDVGGPVVAAAAELPDDPLAYAESLASEGRHRDAVRALYGGAARHLVEAGVVTRMRTRTNREMLRDVTAASPTAAPAFGKLTTDFESTWYGHADPGGAGFFRARESYETLVTGAPPVPPAPAEMPQDGGESG